MATAKQTITLIVHGTGEPELPRTFIDTTIDPFYARPGDFSVNAGQLQQALDQVLAGEIVELVAGTTGGSVTLP